MGHFPFHLADCHGFFAISFGFMPWVICLFIWLIAIGSLPFHLAWCHRFIAFYFGFMPRVHCHGLVAKSICLLAPHLPSGTPNPFAVMAPHLPFGTHICLYGPHSPFGTPHFLGQPKGISSREVKFVLWRAYQQFVKWHPIFSTWQDVTRSSSTFLFGHLRRMDLHPSWSATWRIVLAILASSQNFGLRSPNFDREALTFDLLWFLTCLLCSLRLD